MSNVKKLMKELYFVSNKANEVSESKPYGMLKRHDNAQYYNTSLYQDLEKLYDLDKEEYYKYCNHEERLFDYQHSLKDSNDIQGKINYLELRKIFNNSVYDYYYHVAHNPDVLNHPKNKDVRDIVFRLYGSDNLLLEEKNEKEVSPTKSKSSEYEELFWLLILFLCLATIAIAFF